MSTCIGVCCIVFSVCVRSSKWLVIVQGQWFFPSLFSFLYLARRLLTLAIIMVWEINFWSFRNIYDGVFTLQLEVKMQNILWLQSFFLRQSCISEVAVRIGHPECEIRYSSRFFLAYTVLCFPFVFIEQSMIEPPFPALMWRYSHASNSFLPLLSGGGELLRILALWQVIVAFFAWLWTHAFMDS